MIQGNTTWAKFRTTSRPFIALALLMAAQTVRAASSRAPAPNSAATFPFGGIAPNKMTAGEARATMLGEHDPFFVRAEAQYATAAEPFGPSLTRCNLFGRGNRARKEIALTFDDGPHPGYTERLLSVLAAYHVPATFFVVGEMAERAPGLIREEIADGHSVGNHTYHHVSLVKVTEEQAAAEIKACGLVLESITGKSPRLFRPPGGKYDAAVARAAAAQGYTTVLWTDDPGDYANPGVATIEERTIGTAHNGGILLLHDGVQETIDALPTILTSLRADGYTFVTAEQLIADSGTRTNEAVAVSGRPTRRL